MGLALVSGAHSRDQNGPGRLLACNYAHRSWRRLGRLPWLLYELAIFDPSDSGFSKPDVAPRAWFVMPFMARLALTGRLERLGVTV